MIAALGVLAGVLLGLFLEPDVPLWLEPYLPIAVVAFTAPLWIMGLVRLVEGLLLDGWHVEKDKPDEPAHDRRKGDE